MRFTTITTISIYTIGCIAWIAIWKSAGFFTVLKRKKFLLISFSIVLINFILQIATVLYNPNVMSFAIEAQLMREVEHGTRDILVATFGLLVLSNAYLSHVKNAKLSEDFVHFGLFSIAFIVAGVLMIYWVPGQLPNVLFILRHIKSISYTFGIGFFLSALFSFVYDFSGYGKVTSGDK